MRVSVVVEWENVLRADEQLSSLTLERLAAQSAEVPELEEVRFVFDPDVIDQTVLTQFVRSAFSHATPRIVMQPVTGAHYYGLKNAGAQVSDCDVVVFMDSDVVPSDNWLREIVSPFQASRDCVAVAGFTYIDADVSLIHAAFAAGWFFPMRHEVGVGATTPRFFANNVAFRRDFFVASPFGEMPAGVTRGACKALAQCMIAGGKTIQFAPRAMAVHPPPDGWRNMAIRALAQGRDHAFEHVTLGRRLATFCELSLSVPFEFFRVWSRMGNTQTSGFFARIEAAGLMMGYRLLMAAGAAGTILAPPYARRAWCI